MAVSTCVEFEVEEMEKRNLNHHRRVVVVAKSEDAVVIPPTDEADEASTEEEGTENSGASTGEPPRFVLHSLFRVCLRFLY